MRKRRYTRCDVFTDLALMGNALAVFADADELDAATMQALSREMNLSETAFVLRPTDPSADACIRIFTPAMELPFAGHPTLGTAFVLGEFSKKTEVIRLETKRGTVPVRFSRDCSEVAFGWMTQPLPLLRPFSAGVELLASLGVQGVAPPVDLYDNGPQHLFVELGSPGEVARLRPDFQRLALLGRLAVTAYSSNGERWKSRVFAPGEGIAEDPATGAAAGSLAVHLARRGRVPFGQTIVIDQGAEMGRPSTLHARAVGSAEQLELVEVGGNAVLIGQGYFEI